MNNFNTSHDFRGRILHKLYKVIRENSKFHDLKHYVRKLTTLVVEKLFRTALESLGLKIKKIDLSLHIAKGFDWIEVKVTKPIYLIIPGGTYVLTLEEAILTKDGKDINFDYITITFELTKKHETKILAKELGVQDVYLGDNIEDLLQREVDVVKVIKNALDLILRVLAMSKEVKAAIDLLSSS